MIDYDTDIVLTPEQEREADAMVSLWIGSLSTTEATASTTEATETATDGNGEPPRTAMGGRTFAELRRNREPADMLVEGLLRAKSTSTLAAQTTNGKTYAVATLMARVLSGRPWFGRQVKQGPVLYCPGEGYEDAVERMSAIFQEDPELEAFENDLRITEDVIDFNTFEGMDMVRKEIEAMPNTPKLVILDTRAQFMQGDMQSQQGANSFTKAMRTISLQYKTCVMDLAHLGKDEAKGQSGSLQFKSNNDTELLLVTKKDEQERIQSIQLHASKVKSGAPFYSDIVLKPRTVILKDRFDIFGNPRTQLVFEEYPLANEIKTHADGNRILQLIRDNPGLSKSAYHRKGAERFGISQDMVRRDCELLENMEILVPIAIGGNGKSYVIRDEKEVK